MSTTTATREGWLLAGIDELRPRFREAGAQVPDGTRVTVGFPSVRALSRRKRRLGECWHPSASADGVPHMLITPLVKSGVEALDILTHELCHAAGHHDHRAGFGKLAGAVGLVRPWTSAHAGPELLAELHRLDERLGAFPHGALDPRLRPQNKQSTRMLKIVCQDCGYAARTSAKWIAVGLPTCCCGALMTAPNLSV